MLSLEASGLTDSEKERGRESERDQEEPDNGKKHSFYCAIDFLAGNDAVLLQKREIKINTVGLIMITTVMMILSAQALMISQEYNENQHVFRSSYLLS